MTPLWPRVTRACSGCSWCWSRPVSAPSSSPSWSGATHTPGYTSNTRGNMWRWEISESGNVNVQLHIIIIILGGGSGPLHATINNRPRRPRGVYGSPNIPEISDHPHPTPDPPLPRHSERARHHGPTRNNSTTWTHYQQEWEYGPETFARATNSSCWCRVGFHFL